MIKVCQELATMAEEMGMLIVLEQDVVGYTYPSQMPVE